MIRLMLVRQGPDRSRKQNIKLTWESGPIDFRFAAPELTLCRRLPSVARVGGSEGAMTRTLWAIAVVGAVFATASATSQAAEVSWRDHEAFASSQDEHGTAAAVAPDRHPAKLGALRSTLAKFAREHSEEIQAMF